MVHPSLESCDPPLQGKPTLPSLGQPTVKGAALEVDQTLDFSPFRSCDQGARPLARLGFGFIGTPQKAPLLLSSVAFTTSPFLNSFPRYSTLHPASQQQNPKKQLWRCLHPECPTPGSSRIWWSPYFSGSMLTPLSNEANPVHLLELTPKLFHFPVALPVDYHWLTTLCRLQGIFYVEPMY